MKNIRNTKVLVKKESLLLFIMIITIMDIFPCDVMASETEDKKYGDKIIMVSLGDSYSSGEGIEPFYGQLKQPPDLSIEKRNEAESFFARQAESQDFLAHRSQKSWPGQLRLPGIAMPMNYYKDDSKDNIKWYFCAASGATTYDFENSQEKLYIKALHDQLTDTQIIFEYQKFLDPQKAVFDKIPKGETDYITMSMGGNDAKFEKVIESCVVGSTYLHFSGLSDMLDDIWEDFNSEGGIRDRLSELYSNIEIAAGKQAKILVAGYPRLLEETGKGFFFSQSEAKQVNDRVSDFNDEIEKLITEKNKGGMNIYFVSVEGEDNFDGHGAFSKDPYINPVFFRKRFTDLKDLAAVSAFSMHPNEKGAEVYRKCIQKKIDQLEGVEEDADLNKEAADNIDEEKIYKEYVAETVIPQIGASNMETFTATMYNDDYDGDWGSRNGLFAMDIRDINKDKKEELLLYVCKPYSSSSEYGDYYINNGMYLEIYSIDENGNIYKTDEECIGIYSGHGVAIFGGGYLSIDGEDYLLVEDMSYGVIATGLGYSLHLYQFDNNGHINLAHTISHTGGSTDFSFYCESYSGNGNIDEEVFWADGSYIYSNGDEGIPFTETNSALLDGFNYIFSKLGMKSPNEYEDLSYVTVPCFSKDKNSMERVFRIDTYGEWDSSYDHANFTSSAHSWFSDGFDTSATFILPGSNCKYINRISIENFDAKKLELARNEIFARHGRKFKTDYIQDYFNSKAWYRGTVEPDDFDSNVFNDFEKENINFLLEAEAGDYDLADYIPYKLNILVELNKIPFTDSGYQADGLHFPPEGTEDIDCQRIDIGNYSRNKYSIFGIKVGDTLDRAKSLMKKQNIYWIKEYDGFIQYAIDRTGKTPLIYGDSEYPDTDNPESWIFVTICYNSNSIITEWYVCNYFNSWYD